MKRAFFSVFVFAASGQFFAVSAAGLPEEYLITQRWRTLLSSSSPLTNPAFINEENYLSFRFAGSSILNTFLTGEFGAVYPIGLYQSAGLTYVGQGIGKPYYATDELGRPTNTQIYDNTDYLMATYAYNIWSKLTIGVNLNLLLQRFYNEVNPAITPDLGLTFRVLQHPLVGNHTLGISMQNLLTIPNSKINLPTLARVSLVSTYWERQIESCFDFSFKDLTVKATEFLEGATKQEWNLDAKVGGWILHMIKAYGLLGMDEEALRYLGMALGFNIPSINNGRDLSFLIQYLHVVDAEEAASPASFLSFYAKVDIGKHREEIYARKMARLANLQPNDLYIKACNLYAEGNYWDAFFIFSQLFVEYPDFFKNDWVSFFLGSCQEQMDMRLTAEEAFKKMKELYPRSAAVPFADLGLMRVYYRDGNFGAVESQFNELNKLGVPDSIKYHGYYYMGETELKKESYSKAIQLFDLIPEDHPDFVFAQHSSAICNAATDNFEGAISNLENCIQSQAVTNAQKEVVNRSYVFIGYIFYEELTQQEGPLAKAVTAFRMVPKTSYYYIDALLGLGWTALKARQWNDCKSAGQELASIAENPVMKAEGALLESYAYMMEKNYSGAATVLAGASKALDGYQMPSQAELMSRQDENNALRGKYTDVARKAYDLGTSRQSEIVLKQIDSLHAHQKDFKVKIDEFLTYVDSYERGTFFSRNFESVKEDIDYALAKSQKLGGQIKEQKAIEQFKSDDEKIEEELRKAQEALQKEEEKAMKKDSKKEESSKPEPSRKPEKKDAPAPEPELEPEPLPMDDLPPEELPEEEGWDE